MNKTIVSYNVNGLRAALNKGLLDWIRNENPDILCLQETKIQAGQVDVALFENLGYYHYWHYAVKKGYSGAALLSKTIPDNVSYGIGIPKYDNEGRTVIARFGNISVVSAYFPSGTTGEERQDFKMNWLNDFFNFINDYKRKTPNIILTGDFNICHKPIDINHPKKHETYSGFLPEERAWMDKFTGSGFIDSFRVVNQQPNQYSWWSYRANSRAKNLGWRIDYLMVTEPLKSSIRNAGILKDVVHSDHCPVTLTMDWE
jgi:exodeoxyribonuclease III